MNNLPPRLMQLLGLLSTMQGPLTKNPSTGLILNVISMFPPLRKVTIAFTVLQVAVSVAPVVMKAGASVAAARPQLWAGVSGKAGALKRAILARGKRPRG